MAFLKSSRKMLEHYVKILHYYFFTTKNFHHHFPLKCYIANAAEKTLLNKLINQFTEMNYWIKVNEITI
jgi:hypothetical protein